MSTFGCCGLYVECSNEKKCLQLGNDNYIGCQYRKNLEAGRIFYGINKDKPAHKRGMYLHCFNRLFKIAIYSKGNSYSLNEAQIGEISTLFDTVKIPYKTQIEDDLCVTDTVKENDTCNAFVLIDIAENTYKISNYNSYLIKSKTAELICKAFANKNISSQVCVSQREYNRVYTVNIKPIVQQCTKIEPEQLSIMQLIS